VCSTIQSYTPLPVGYEALEVMALASGSTVSAGSYSIQGGGSAQGSVGAVVTFAKNTGGSCPWHRVDATSGTVTITSADSSSVSGSFDVGFASGDHASGPFSATVCYPGPPPDGAVLDAGPGFCD